MSREPFETSRRDAWWMGRNYAAGYTWTGPDGGINDRKTDIADTANVTFESMEASDTRVSVSGDTGVVTGVSTVKGKFKDQDISGTYRFTDTFARRGGQWMILASRKSEGAAPPLACGAAPFVCADSRANPRGLQT
jgi:hypothetical protein